MTVGELSGVRGRADPTAAAIRLAELGIAVTPGANVSRGGVCTCGSPACRTPGRHPLDPAWLLHATTNADSIQGWWHEHPDANIVAPLLGPYHIVDAPARIGRLVLDWLGGYSSFTGPVAVTPEERYHFWALPGVAVEIGVLLDRRGYSLAAADLRIHREGAYVLLPPSAIGPFSNYRWKLPPHQHVRDLPSSGWLVWLLLQACRHLGIFAPPHAGT